MDWSEYTISDVKEHLSKLDINEITDKLLISLNKDSRVGVQNLAAKYKRLLNAKKNRIEKWKKMSQNAVDLQDRGYQLVAGIDEAGRGPLAGPVVASAVILDLNKPIYGLDDSKKLSEKKREELYKVIMEDAIAVGIGIINNNIIDQINILQATFKAMESAIEDLSETPDYVLVDGNMKIPNIKHRQDCIVDGDCFINSIAAASIIAKVTRDRIIDDYHNDYPHYGFNRNKGYGTSEHIQALKEHGTTPIHRFSFSIVNRYHFTHFENHIKQARSEDELKELGQLIAKRGLFSEDNLNKLRELYQDQFRNINKS